MKQKKFVITLLTFAIMATMLMACSSKAAPAEDTKETEAAVEKEETVEVAEVKEAESTAEPTAEPTPEPIVYEGIDMNSTLPGAEWATTFDGIITEPKYFIFNDSTNKKVIVEQGQEVEFEDNDSLGLYRPEGEGKTEWVDKNLVFGNSYPGRIYIFTELWEGFKEDGFAVMESDITLNGEQYTITATLILK